MATDTQDTTRHTDHALLVGLGLFGHQIGLFDALDEVRFPGRVYKRAPQRKLRELLAALAAGYQQLQEIDLAADAIRADPVVIAAWDPQGFAHYSGVSRCLCQADATTVSDLKAALDRVSTPFLARDVEEALAAGGPLRLEGDTTGVATTTQLPGVEPGLIEGRLQPGFRLASLSLRTPLYRITLGSAHFEGKRVSCQTLENLIILAEQRVGRPWRRVDLLHAQLEVLKQEEQRRRDKAHTPQSRAQGFEERFWELHFLIRQTQEEVEVLEAQQAGKGVRPHSRLAQARRRLTTYQRWQVSARRRQQEAERIARRYLDRAEGIWAEQQALQTRIARYHVPHRAERGLDKLRDVVRVAMRSQAEINYEADGCIMKFAPKGAFAGLVIDLRQPLAFQLSLPLFAKLPVFVESDSTRP